MTDAPSTPPERIKVGPLVYDVVVDELAIVRARAEAGDPRIGEHDEKNLRIVMAPDLAPGQARATLLHEVLHALTAATTLDRIVASTEPCDLDERIVGVLEMPLLAVLRDNPELLAFLTAD